MPVWCKPYYNRPSPEGVLAHFQELDKVGIPLILYNIPAALVLILELTSSWSYAKSVRQ